MSQGNKIIFTQKKNQRSMLKAKIAMYIIYFKLKITRLRENNEVQINATFSQNGCEYLEDLKSFN